LAPGTTHVRQDGGLQTLHSYVVPCQRIRLVELGGRLRPL
jgi:hypothetical protein